MEALQEKRTDYSSLQALTMRIMVSRQNQGCPQTGVTIRPLLNEEGSHEDRGRRD